jgi:hypothetical protein
MAAGKAKIKTPHQRHFVRSAVVAVVLVTFAVGIGVVGYHYLNGEAWIDALVDATMILGGMGPVSPLTNDAAKLFASFYALFSGLMFIATAAVLVAPWAHRLLHRLNADADDKKSR